MPERLLGKLMGQRILRTEQLSRGTLREVDVAGRMVLVAKLHSGEVVAAEAICPHERARLAEGTIRGEAVDCPRHHYLFDLHNGRNLYPFPIYPAWKQKEVGDLSLKIFPCWEQDGWLWLKLPD